MIESASARALLRASVTCDPEIEIPAAAINERPIESSQWMAQRTSPTASFTSIVTFKPATDTSCASAFLTQSSWTFS
jgi:hypothetical protein